jgi:hypothetical protein
MGKRSTFSRIPADQYDTPDAAVTPLAPHLAPRTRFIEPCRGAGKLVGHLRRLGHRVVGLYDLPVDARTHRYPILTGAIFITNPPWSRPVLHQIIVNLSDQAPTWLLIDADWIHTLQAVPFLTRLREIVSVGRVRWLEGTPYTGKDNCAWHLFDRRDLGAQAVFFGRQPRGASRASCAPRAESDASCASCAPRVLEAAE